MELASASAHLIRGFDGDDLMAKRCQPPGVSTRASSYIQDKRRSRGNAICKPRMRLRGGTPSYRKTASLAFASYQSMGSMGFNDSPSAAIRYYHRDLSHRKTSEKLGIRGSVLGKGRGSVWPSAGARQLKGGRDPIAQTVSPPRRNKISRALWRPRLNARSLAQQLKGCRFCECPLVGFRDARSVLAF